MRTIKRIDYSEFVTGSISEDHKIGNDILLLDEHRLNMVKGYEFTAIRTTFIEVLNGDGWITIEGRRYEVKGHCIIGYFKGQHIVSQIKKSLQRGVMFSETFMDNLYLGAIKYHDLYNAVMSNPVFPVEPLLADSLSIYVQGIKNIASRPDNHCNVLSAKFLTLSLFYSPLHELFKSSSQENGTSRSPSISNRFLFLLQENYTYRYELGFYADKLNISVRYLYASVVASTGKSPKQWINQTLTSESKRLLENPDLSILQVSQILHFSTLQSFGKFFRVQTGMSPRDFRIQLQM